MNNEGEDEEERIVDTGENVGITDCDESNSDVIIINNKYILI